MFKILFVFLVTLTSSAFANQRLLDAVGNDSSADVTRILNTDPTVKINIRDEEGHTPILIASAHANFQIFSLLQKGGADINLADKDGMTPLLEVMYSKKSPEIAEALLSMKVNPNQSNADGQTALLFAVQNAFNESKPWIQITKKLVTLGVDINHRNLVDETALHFAVQSQSIELTDFLLSQGANPNLQESEYGRTVLSHAAAWGYDSNRQKQIVALLLAARADPNIKDKEGLSALMNALAWNAGSIEVLELLIQSGANVNLADEQGDTALAVACLRGKDITVLNLLLDKGAELNHMNAQGETALLLGLGDSDRMTEEMALLLIERGSLVKSNGARKPLVEALRRKFRTAAMAMIRRGADVSTPDYRKFTPLYYAIEQNDDEMVGVLLKNGASTEIQIDDRYTPLFFAAEFGRTDIVKKLLSAGANVRAQDQFRSSILSMPASLGYTDIIKLLLAYGANPNQRDGSIGHYYGPLHYAAEKGHIEIVRALIAANAEVDLKGESDETPLMLTALPKHVGQSGPNQLEVAKELLSHGASKNRTDLSGKNVYGYLQDNRDAEFRQKLREILDQYP